MKIKEISEAITKKYIILAYCVSGMGGGQMYTANKLVYMSELGWEVKVVSFVGGTVIIPELKQYENDIVCEISNAPQIFSPRRREKIINLLISMIGPFDEAIIESSNATMALWGEILAKKLNCKHMVHLLCENNQGVPEQYLDFYRFKHARRELSGININSLKMLFRYSEDINDENSYYLPSVCTNVVVPSEVDPIGIPKTGITMCCIGRLAKEYVMAAASAFKSIVVAHTDELFNVLFIGDSDDEKIKNNIKAVFEDTQNVNLIMPGAVFPIPSSIFPKISVFVSSAGSANVSYRSNRPTISIDARDLQAIGVLGYTTQNSTYRKQEPQQDIAELIEKIIFQDYLSELMYTEPTPVSLAPLQLHVDFLNSSEKSKEYFPVDKMKAAGSDKKKRIIRILFGGKTYLQIRKVLLKLKKKR